MPEPMTAAERARWLAPSRSAPPAASIARRPAAPVAMPDVLAACERYNRTRPKVRPPLSFDNLVTLAECALIAKHHTAEVARLDRERAEAEQVTIHLALVKRKLPLMTMEALCAEWRRIGALPLSDVSKKLWQLFDDERRKRLRSGSVDQHAKVR